MFKPKLGQLPVIYNLYKEKSPPREEHLVQDYIYIFLCKVLEIIMTKDIPKVTYSIFCF